ncbi:MAG: tRNA glutamyl-Q(34) synthetase GluQRS [Actinomycetota bacterium]
MTTGRYAPSPTGTFHLGNLRTAIAAWLYATVDGGACLLRWEDLDLTASPEHEASQRADFERLGLRFDGPELRQSDRIEAYRDALYDLERRGLTYPCWCSRKDIREAPTAPHGPPGSYPGTCRDLTRAEVAQRRSTGRPPAIRLRADATAVTVIDRLNGEHTEIVDDFVVQRFDATPAYNLAVVVDDAFQGVDQVVRGADLLASSPRHAYLHRVLGTPEPEWIHVPLVLDEHGDRLAKRDGSAGLDEWLAAGRTIGEFLSDVAVTFGLETPRETDLREIAASFPPDAPPPAGRVTYDQGAGTLSLTA